MKFLLSFSVLVLALLCNREAFGCTITTASGSHAPKNFCHGDLIFEDNFDKLDFGKWKHDITMWGGGNNEFQWYVNDRKNSFAQGGKLHLRPTKTSDLFGEDFIYKGRVVIPPYECNISENRGCNRQGEEADGDEIINPIRSGKISSAESFAFKYGVLEIRAKAPAGDWLWPALWMMPKHSVYGGWPTSGEIDLMESRGNRQLYDGEMHVGNQMVSSTLHYGAYGQNGFERTLNFTHNSEGYDKEFHNYRVVWTKSGFEFFVDGELTNKVTPTAGGFWEFGGFSGVNPWLGREVMAPFDQEFYIMCNLAVGGWFFPNNFVNRPYPKPFDSDHHSRMAREFWEGRSDWEPTWNMDTEDRDFQVDYVRVWAL